MQRRNRVGEITEPWGTLVTGKREDDVLPAAVGEKAGDRLAISWCLKRLGSSHRPFKKGRIERQAMELIQCYMLYVCQTHVLNPYYGEQRLADPTARENREAFGVRVTNWIRIAQSRVTLYKRVKLGAVIGWITCYRTARAKKEGNWNCSFGGNL